MSQAKQDPGNDVPVWSRPNHRKKEYELQARDDLMGTLRFERGSLAHAEAGGHRWTFKRRGFWRSRFTIQSPGSASDIGVFRRSGWRAGGVLALQGGRRFQLRATNFWLSAWVWKEDDTVLIRFEAPDSGNPTAVTIMPAATGLGDKSLLLVLGWYLAIQIAEEQSEAMRLGAAG